MADTVHSWGGAVDRTADAPIRRGGLQRFARRRSTIALLMCMPLILIVTGLIIYPAF
jgi:multiple sugar transport system permease protein